MLDKQYSDRLIDRRKPVCPSADEWAEQTRMMENDKACDDETQEVTCGDRKYEDPCRI